MAVLPSDIFGFNYLLASNYSNKEFNCGFPGNGILLTGIAGFFNGVKPGRDARSRG